MEEDEAAIYKVVICVTADWAGADRGQEIPANDGNTALLASSSQLQLAHMTGVLGPPSHSYFKRVDRGQTEANDSGKL